MICLLQDLQVDICVHIICLELSWLYVFLCNPHLSPMFETQRLCHAIVPKKDSE